MGQNVSTVDKIQNGQTIVNVIGKGITSIPYEIPETFHIKSLNLSQNRIKNLPKSLPFLCTLVLASNNYKKVPKDVEETIKNYKELVSLDLSSNSLKSLPKSLLQHQSIIEINVFGNSIKEIDLSESTLVSFNVGKNELTKMPILGPKLETLSAEMNSIEDFIASNPVITKLFLSMNKISSIPEGLVFSNLTNIDLSRNNIKTLPSLKEMCPSLQVLDVSYNMLEKLPSLPSSIRQIIINNNKVTFLPRLSLYVHLLSINFSYNSVRRITAIPKRMITFIGNNNRISSMEQCETTKLSVFSVDKNKLIEMPLHDGNKITNYAIRGNLFKSINLSVLSDKLIALDLCDNQIEDVPKELFMKPNLKTLALAHNKITKLPRGIKESELQDLDISFNSLIEFPKSLPHALERLSIACCSLSEFPPAYDNVYELVELDISENRLKKLPFFPDLLKLYASENIFTSIPRLSDCIEEVDLSYNRISKVKGFTSDSLLVLDLSFNIINSEPEINAPELQHMSLRGNPLSCSVDLGSCRNLESLFVTKATPINVAQGCEVYSPNPTLSTGFLCLESLDNVSYAQTKGIGMNHSDIIVSNKTAFGNERMVGYVLATKDFDVARNFANALIDGISKTTKQGEEEIKNAIENAERSVEANATMLDPSQTAFIVYSKGVPYFAGCTQIPIFIVNDSNEVRCVRETRWPRKELNCVINYLVFQTLPIATVGQIKLEPTDKWIVIMNVNISDTIGKSVFTEICERALNSHELVFNLKNYARSINKLDNLTAIAIDIKNERR